MSRDVYSPHAYTSVRGDREEANSYTVVRAAPTGAVRDPRENTHERRQDTERAHTH